MGCYYCKNITIINGFGYEKVNREEKCEWVNEFSEQWPLYRCWTEAERDTHARKVAADLADDRADAEGISVSEAFEVEYEAIYAMHPVIISQWQVAA